MDSVKSIVCKRWLPQLGCAVLTGCAGAPSQNVFGSYFPSWMLCAFAGLFGSIVIHQVLTTTGLGKSVPAPLLLYLALAVAISFAAWLAWIG